MKLLTIILSQTSLTIVSGVGIFLLITLLLVAVLLTAKHFLVHSGKVKITINNDTTIEADSGKARGGEHPD